jgi:hypothetical protein
MANTTGSISYGPYGTMTFTDGQNYRVTIPAIDGSRASDPSNPDFHNYTKSVVIDDMTPYAVRSWVIENPTANSHNNPATHDGVYNDATPGFGFRLLLAEISSLVSTNDVRTFTAIDEITGDPVVINVTQKSHILHFGAVIQIVKELPNGKLILIRYGIGDGILQSPHELTADFLINKIWLQHFPGAKHPIPYPLMPRCFPADTSIQTSLTSNIPISDLGVGDTILAFDPTADLGRGALVPRRVTRLFRNSTTEWLKLTWLDPASGEAKELVATPGHNMLDKFGHFTRLDALVKGNTCEIILSSGDCIMAQAERLVYTSATADMFERATAMAATSGALAIAPHALDAWATYNFEVEDLHTYVAGGVRVHNDSLYAPVTDLGRLGDNVASQISDFAFGKNTLGSVFAGSALRSVLSTLGDAIKGQASFDPYHLTGRYIYDLAGGLGNLSGTLLMQDLVSGLGIRGPAATAQVQFGGGAAGLLAQESTFKSMIIPSHLYNFHLQHAKARAKNVNRDLTTLRAGAFWFTQTLAA